MLALNMQVNRLGKMAHDEEGFLKYIQKFNDENTFTGMAGW
jgi:hypothetical protein